MYSTPGMFVVRADSPVPHDRRPARQAGGVRRAGLGAGDPRALRARRRSGLDQERDFQAVYLERAGDGPAMVLDGRVAALWGGGIGWPGFTAVAKAPGGARFIAPDADGIAPHPGQARRS